MSYQDIPDKFQPIEIVGNNFHFPDGVYQCVEQDYYDHVQTVHGTYTLPLTVVGTGRDNPETDPVPTFLQGVRRVRNIQVDADLFVRMAQPNYTVNIFWNLDIVVLRQGQTAIFTRDVLARASGNMYLNGAQPINTEMDTDEDLCRFCYPGYVDLSSGDSIVCRLSIIGPTNQYGVYINYSINCTALVKFG